MISNSDEQNDLEKNLPIDYIHADNVLFCSDENKLAAVLDFDDMYIGPLLNDLALCLWLWCRIGSTLNFEYAKEF